MKTLHKNIFAAIFLSLFLTGLVGIYAMDMDMSSGHTAMAAHCPFSPGSALCTMTPFEHISAAQHLFTALPQEANFLLLLVVLAPLSLWLFWRSKLRVTQPLFEYHYLSPHSFLQEAFSSGILNSKAF